MQYCQKGCNIVKNGAILSLTIDEGHLDSERNTQRAEAKRDLAEKITGQHLGRFSDSLAFGRASGLGNLSQVI